MRILILVISLVLAITSSAASRNGFDLDGALIAPSDIRSGGPPRDGIPAINKPKYVSAAKADWLKAEDWVMGVVIDGDARAFPIRILNWHEIVNTKWSGKPYVVSFCPLCGTGMVFRAESEGQDLEFGVSGLLFQSDMLLYDRQSDSLWSQIMAQAVTGPMKGNKLELINSSHTTFAAWLQRYPDTTVLDINTGYRRNYNRDPYQGYAKSQRLFFPVKSDFPSKYHPKDEIIGLEYAGRTLAIPYRELSEVTTVYNWEGKQWTIQWRDDVPEAWVEDELGKQYPTVRSFIFAWYGFHPDTSLYEQ